MARLYSELASKGYWPALAMEYFAERKYSRAIELCMIRLREYPEVLSGRIVYARALYHTGQYESAEEQFYKVLQRDPDNQAALKYLGDLKFLAGDEATAFAYYSRVLESDPKTSALASQVNFEEIEQEEKTRVLTLKKRPEKIDEEEPSLREMPFITETLGDLLLKQGHPRLALKIFRELALTNSDPNLLDKIDKTEQSFKK